MLEENRPAFLLGNTAPDVQTISGQPRKTTHFFDLPILPDTIPAWECMWQLYPALARSPNLPAAQRVFIAGYLCHLQADWEWICKIYAPIFLSGPLWTSPRHRSYLHNVLRAYLDFLLLADLPADLAFVLSNVQPREWLPFVADGYLIQWRDFLASQLCEDCEIQTVEVFAARQGVPAEKYYALLNSEARLEQEVFSIVPRRNLDDYREQVLISHLSLLEAYLIN